MKDRSFAKFLPHGTGHWLGLDVHDAGSYEPGALPDPKDRFRASMSFAAKLGPGWSSRSSRASTSRRRREGVDPKWWNTGVRIEDDILVTEKGPECLSCDAPARDRGRREGGHGPEDPLTSRPCPGPFAFSRTPSSTRSPRARSSSARRPRSRSSWRTRSTPAPGASRWTWRAAGSRGSRSRTTARACRPEDARLALERHATSKIRSFEDLVAHRDDGFPRRGAPVDRVRLAPRPHDVARRVGARNRGRRRSRRAAARVAGAPPEGHARRRRGPLRERARRGASSRRAPRRSCAPS